MSVLQEPLTRKWSQGEFHQMADLGWFEGQKAELLEGEIVVQSPQKSLHYATTDKVGEILRIAFGRGFWVRTQGPMDFGEYSEPEPDISVVAGNREDYADHPQTALLIVEVSDSTLSSDRNRKASLYALMAIQEYWIVNLQNDVLEVYRAPAPDPSKFYGHGYSPPQILKAGETISPLAKPSVLLEVKDLLP